MMAVFARVQRRKWPMDGTRCLVPLPGGSFDGMEGPHAEGALFTLEYALDHFLASGGDVQSHEPHFRVVGADNRDAFVGFYEEAKVVDLRRGDDKAPDGAFPGRGTQ
jgi:hypothetical protein